MDNKDTKFPATVDDWGEFVKVWAEEKGWVFGLNDTPEKIALMHSELSEALEAYRRREGFFWNIASTEVPEAMKPEGIAIELADCVIRIMHYLSTFGISLQEALELKMAYNLKRPYRHGDKKA